MSSWGKGEGLLYPSASDTVSIAKGVKGMGKTRKVRVAEGGKHDQDRGSRSGEKEKKGGRNYDNKGRYGGREEKDRLLSEKKPRGSHEYQRIVLLKPYKGKKSSLLNTSLTGHRRGNPKKKV